VIAGSIYGISGTHKDGDEQTLKIKEVEKFRSGGGRGF
jgi:hypothetical protein